MTTFTTCFYSYNNSYALKVATVKLTVAAAWLRKHGCIFSTYSDRNSGRTKIYLKHCPESVIKALTRKYGFFNAAKSTVKPAPAPASTPVRTMGKGEISREEWLSRFRSNTNTVAQPKRRKIRNADELPADADALKPIPVVVPQLCVEDKLYNKSMVNGVVVVTGTYTCRTVQIEGDGFLKAERLDAYRPQTNADLAEGVSNADQQQAIVDAVRTPIHKLTNSQLRAACMSNAIDLSGFGKQYIKNNTLINLLHSAGIKEV